MLTGAVLSRSSWADTLAGAGEARAQRVHSLWLLDERDPFVMLAALAAEVPGISFGMTLDGVMGRPPQWLAKQLTTLALLLPNRLHVLERGELAVVKSVKVALSTSRLAPRAPALHWWSTHESPRAVVTDGFSPVPRDAVLVISEPRF